MGKSEKKSKKKHKHKRKEHKEKYKSKSKKSKNEAKLKKEMGSTPQFEIDGVQSKAASAPVDASSDEDFAIPIALMNSKSHAPETPEEYQRRQSQIRRETDPVTGRTRLIKGDSEILEEIVCKQRHSEINKKATSGDGDFFEAQSFAAARRRTQK